MWRGGKIKAAFFSDEKFDAIKTLAQMKKQYKNKYNNTGLHKT